MAQGVRRLGFAAAALASACLAAQPVVPERAGNAADLSGNPFAELTDAQWAAVAGAWEDLSGAERRWFLTESRKRDATPRSKTRFERLVYRERARFGRVAPAAPSAVRDQERDRGPAQGPAQGKAGVEREARAAEELRDDRRYGLGFEERQREGGGLTASERPAGASATRPAEQSGNWRHAQTASYRRPAARPEGEPGPAP